MATGKNIFKAPHFTDEDAARVWFEAARWPNGPTCPHCRSLKHYATKKAGRYRCGEKECRKDYTVMTKSIMERSHAKLTQWAMAFHLYASSKKGFTAAQLERMLGCEYNTAWFLHHRVMEAMRRGGLDVPPMGGPGKVVEIDEAYHGNVPEASRRPSPQRKGRPYLKGGRVDGPRQCWRRLQNLKSNQTTTEQRTSHPQRLEPHCVGPNLCGSCRCSGAQTETRRSF